MADPTPGDDAGVRPDRGSPPGMPGWVKVFGIIIIVLVVVVVVVLLLSGGRGGHGPGRHSPSGAAIGDTPSSIAAENTGGASGPADADDAIRTVEVTTFDAMTFEPGMINVSAGETVTFVVTNAGQIVHEFTLGDAAMQQEHAGSIRLQPGETKQLTWRFGDTGALEYACHEAGHYQAGMRGQIAIN